MHILCKLQVTNKNQGLCYIHAGNMLSPGNILRSRKMLSTCKMLSAVNMLSTVSMLRFGNMESSRGMMSFFVTSMISFA